MVPEETFFIVGAGASAAWTATLPYVPGRDVLGDAVCAENVH
jgi:hypothetical protein